LKKTASQFPASNFLKKALTKAGLNSISNNYRNREKNSHNIVTLRIRGQKEPIRGAG
jgi:hypothetical protein